MRICSRCSIEKEISEFHKDKGFKDGLYRWCKSCKKGYDKIYRQSEKVQKLYKSKEYKIRKIEYNAKKSNIDRRQEILNRIKCKAKKLGIPFNLEISDIIIPEYCPILEMKLCDKPYGQRGGKGGGFKDNNPSIDKIDPTKGYIKGNIQIISMKANAMKYSASKEELITFCTNILKQIKNKKYDRIMDS